MRVTSQFRSLLLPQEAEKKETSFSLFLWLPSIFHSRQLKRHREWSEQNGAEWLSMTFPCGTDKDSDKKDRERKESAVSLLMTHWPGFFSCKDPLNSLSQCRLCIENKLPLFPCNNFIIPLISVWTTWSIVAWLLFSSLFLYSFWFHFVKIRSLFLSKKQRRVTSVQVRSSDLLQQTKAWLEKDFLMQTKGQTQRLHVKGFRFSIESKMWPLKCLRKKNREGRNRKQYK